MEVEKLTDATAKIGEEFAAEQVFGFFDDLFALPRQVNDDVARVRVEDPNLLRPKAELFAHSASDFAVGVVRRQNAQMQRS